MQGCVNKNLYISRNKELFFELSKVLFLNNFNFITITLKANITNFFIEHFRKFSDGKFVLKTTGYFIVFDFVEGNIKRNFNKTNG